MNQAVKVQRWRGRAFKRLGGICVCCEEHRKQFLTFDHIHGGGRAQRRELGSLNFYRWIATDADAPSLIRVLCMNCNWGIRNGKTCPHLEDTSAEQKREMELALEEQIKDLTEQRDRLLKEIDRLNVRPMAGEYYVRHLAPLDWKEFEAHNGNELVPSPQA